MDVEDKENMQVTMCIHCLNDGIPITDYETVIRCSFMVDEEE